MRLASNTTILGPFHFGDAQSLLFLGCIPVNTIDRTLIMLNLELLNTGPKLYGHNFCFAASCDSLRVFVLRVLYLPTILVS